MKRKQLLAAETFRYSYAHYADHLEGRNVRFTKYMPDDVATLEKAERDGWDDATLARVLDTPEESARLLRESYRKALDIVDAPTPAEAFRRSVRYSIRYTLQEGLETEEDVEALVVQICYRAADLGYLLDMTDERLSEYSETLRKEPGVTYWDDQSPS
jgi:hypothetical protein